MTESGAYGSRLAEAFHIRNAPTFVTRSLNHVEIAVTQVICGAGKKELTSAVECEDGFLVKLQMRDWQKRVLWQDDRPVRADPLKAGSLSIFSLRSTWIGQRLSPFHSISFYLPRKALNAIADIEETAYVQEFDHDPGIGVEDQTVAALGASLLPAFERPHEANHLFVDHVTTAAAAHILRAYGVGQKPQARTDTHLAPWQERLVKEMLRGNLDGAVSTAKLANECGMSITAFSRSFVRTVGTTPPRWLLEQRVAKAMTLLKERDKSLAEVAKACGFASREHLARVFARRVGVGPQAWRSAIHH